MGQISHWFAELYNPDYSPLSNQGIVIVLLLILILWISVALRQHDWLWLFRFPRRNDQRSSWVERLLKVVVVAATMAVFVLEATYVQENTNREPYWIYSFEKNFGETSAHDYTVVNCNSPFTACGGPEWVVHEFYFESLRQDPERKTYIDDLEAQGFKDAQVAEKLEATFPSMFANLRAAEINAHDYYLHRSILFLFVVPLLAYLALIHVLYRTAMYIIFGHRHEMPSPRTQI